MDKKEYKKLFQKHTPKEDKIKNEIIAFLIGGFMGLLGQLTIDLYASVLDITTKEAGSYMIVTFIFLTCLFTGLAFFDKIYAFAKAGLLVPITGFAHSMMSAALEYRKEGLVNGIGSNIFKIAGSVILYGVVSAYTFGLIRFLLFGA